MLFANALFLATILGCSQETESNRTTGNDTIAGKEIPHEDLVALDSMQLDSNTISISQDTTRPVTQPKVDPKKSLQLPQFEPGKRPVSSQNPQLQDSIYQENLRKKRIRDSIRDAGQ